jgi:hypothetical protein
MEITVDHNLTQDEALERVKKALSKAGVKYSDMVSDVQEEWNDCTGTCSFKVKGFKVKAKVTVGPERVYMKGNIPWLLSGFSSKIEDLLRENMLQVLAS